jgi:hypothetical protein
MNVTQNHSKWTYNEGTYIDESHVSNFNETNNSFKFYVNEGTYYLHTTKGLWNQLCFKNQIN